MNCYECGKCCLKDVAHKLLWLKSDFTYDQKQELVAEIKNRKQVKNACDMLILDNGKYLCLVAIVFGKEKRPTACINYPTDEKCANGRTKQEVGFNIIDK